MREEELSFLEAHQLAALYRQRKLSPVEVTQSQLSRIARMNDRLHCFAHVVGDIALRQAQLAEQALQSDGPHSPLLGIPVGYKDLLDTENVVTAAGMPLHAKRIPKRNATVVNRLQAAGTIMLGKLQMTEGAFAIHHPGIQEPVNPWSAEVWTGASSSGNGVALAAGLCFGAIGSDTGGSIRFPSAANGLTGLKPTWGRVSRYGTFEMATTLDHIGPMARSARDVMLLFAAIAGHDPLDATSLPMGRFDCDAQKATFTGLRVGIDEKWLSQGVDRETQRALHEAMDIIQHNGGRLVPFSMPDTGMVSGNWELHCGVQTALAHAATYPAKARQYGPALKRLIEQGAVLSALDYQEIILQALDFTGALNACFTEIDLIFAPVQPVAAPTHEQLASLAADPEANRQLIQFTAPINVSGHPALSVPIGFTAQGLPIGGQFIAPKGLDELAIQAGLAFQSLTNWHCQHPDLNH